MAAQLYDSLHQKLLTLPADLEIYPGHQAGSACGVGLSSKPASTIGFEKRWNAALTLEKSAFVEYVTKEIPPSTRQHGSHGAGKSGLGALRHEHGADPPRAA